MKICPNCGRNLATKEEFEKMLGNPYVLAISDKEFLEFLRRKEHAEKI